MGETSSTSSPARSPARSEVFLLFLALVGGVFFRLAYLDGHSLWVDELITMVRVVLSPKEIIDSLFMQGPKDIGPDYSPPLYHLLLNAVLAFGRNDFVIKLPGVLLDSGTIIILWALVRTLFNERAALITATIYSFSGYMIYFSRTIRPYSLFFFLAMLSLLAFVKALETNKTRYWALYAIAAAASLWTILTAVANLAGLGVFLCMTMAAGLVESGPGKTAWRPMRNYLLATGLALLCYSPWLPSHAYVYELSKLMFPPGPRSPITASGFVHAFNRFVAYFTYDQTYSLVSLALALLGIGWSLTTRKFKSTLLLLAWSFPPLFIFLATDSSYPFFPRRIITMFFPLIIFISLGIDGVVTSVTSWRFKTAGLIFVFACALGYSYPNIASLDVFYRSNLSEYKQQALQTYLIRNNCDYFASQGGLYSNFPMNWYLPNVFRDLSSSSSREYKRVLWEIGPQPGAVLPGVKPLLHLKFHHGQFDYYRVGLLNRAPIIVLPDTGRHFRYKNDFSGIDFYRDAFSWENVWPNNVSRCLQPFARGKDGHAVLAFDLGETRSVDSAVVHLKYATEKWANADSRDVISLLASVDGEKYATLGATSGEEFQSVLEKVQKQLVKTYALEKSYVIPKALLSGPRLYLKIEFLSGKTLSPMDLAELTAEFVAEPANPEAESARLYLKNIRKNAGLRRFNPRMRELGGKTTYAFDLEGKVSDAPWLGNTEDRRALLEAYPGAQPIMALYDKSGKAVFEIYDPFLDAPFISVDAAGEQRLSVAASFPVEVRDVSLCGVINSPDLSVDQTSISAPVSFPGGTMVVLREDRPATAFFQPIYSREEYDPGQFFLSQNMFQNGVEASLRCENSTNCSFSYLFQSEQPLESLRFTYYPRLFNDPARKNKITVSSSLDYKNFHVLQELRSDGSGYWSELNQEQTVSVPLNKPRNFLWIRFEMSYESCQIQSSREYPTYFVASFASQFKKFHVLKPECVISSAFEEPNAFQIELAPKLGGIPEYLLRGY